MNRVFISYRSADGKKDAGRLAHDLNRALGADAVFFDKQDLRGGSAWRDAIGAALHARPVVLLVVTPRLLEDRTPDGARRIDAPDDPVRGELMAAHAAGARVVPLLTEGVAMPPAADWPAALAFLADTHALKLRTEDWDTDWARLMDDLAAHGIRPPTRPSTRPRERSLRPASPRPASPSPGHARWGAVIGAVTLALGLALALTMALTTGWTGSAGQGGSASATVAGEWIDDSLPGRPVRVVIEREGDEFTLRSEPVPLEDLPDWAAYAERQRAQGMTIETLRYTARGPWRADAVHGPMTVVGGGGAGPLDTGALSLTLQDGGRTLAGTLWSNGDQDAEAVTLRRP